jgi:hypothetical protein
MILSLVTPHFAIQVSDRRLTEEIAANQFDTWDPASNKSVILLGRDGLIAMGYGGAGFIGSATTDGWIAETITGLSMGANLDRPDFALRTGDALPDRVVCTHLETVADGLNWAVGAGQIDADELMINYVGFRWDSLEEPAWPVFGAIAWSPADRYEVVMSEPDWGWESGRDHQFAALGWSEVEAREELRKRLPSMEIGNKNQAISILIDVLRSLPPEDTTVSKDCMVTTIQRIPPHAHVRYERYGLAEAEVASRTQTFTVPASFSPWILTPEWLTTPQVMSGLGWTRPSGIFEFAVEGSGGNGDFSIMSGQPRRTITSAEPQVPHGPQPL